MSKSLLSKSALKAVSYWAPNAILKHLASLPDLESAGVHPRVGLQTSNDFRFLRLQWEVPGEDIGRDCWVPFAKGGEYNPYADAMHLCVLWHDGAKEQRAFSEMHADRTGSSRGNDATRDFEYYYKQGLTYSERTTSDISVRILPEGTITGTSGPGIYFDEKVSALSGLVYFSSRTFRQLLELSIGSGDAVYSGSAARHYTVGNLSSSPVPLNLGSQLDNLSIRLIRSARKILSSDSTVPGPIGWDVMANLATGIEGIAKRRSEEIGSELITMLKDVCESERIIHQYLGLDESSIKFIEEQGGPLPDSFSSSEPDKDRLQELWCLSMEQLVYVASAEVGASRQITKKSWYADRRVELISAILGVNGVDIVKSILKIDPYAFCSLKTVAKRVIEEALNIAFGCSRIVNGDPSDIERNPFHPAWAICARKVQGQSKVFACDEGHEFDIGKSITDVLGNIIGDSASDLIEEIRSALETRSITDFFRKAYFAPHIRQYSNSRRKAPIHWQFGTQSSNYSVWVCYHSLNKDTLYRVLQDFVIPRIQYEEKSLRTYRQEAGQSPSAKQRKEIINSESALNGLIEFRHEIEKVAPLWNPNLNDGVIINAAPLWKLFGHQRGWQKDCKNTWDKMVAGEYDWSHLAMHLWPERVIRNCIQDRSLAVAHGIEHLIWHENSNGKWAAIQPDDSSLNKLVSDRYSSAIDDSLKCLINTSQPSKTRSNSKAATSQGGAP